MDKAGFNVHWTTMNKLTTRRWLLCCLLILGDIQECWQLVIKNVHIPATVKADETDYVILDCDYDLENTPRKGLVVKWFFDGNEVAYQWIYGMDPQAAEVVSKYIELMYKASDDPYTMYRAMKLNKPGIELTGEYTCVISTFADERIANATMVVYTTESKFDLIPRKKTIDKKDGVEVTCTAKGLYPQPTLDISVEGVPTKQTPTPTVTLRDDGLYDILSRTALLDEDLPEAAIVKCLLGIPRANYNVSRKTVYYPGVPPTTTATTKLLRKMEIQALGNSEPGNGGGSSADQKSISVLLMLAHLMFFTVFVL